MMRLIFLAAMLFAITAVSAQTPPASAIPAPSDVAAPPVDATKTPSGLATKVITPGTGKDHPGKEEAVTVSYTEWTADGKMFDSTVTRGKPVTLVVSHVLPGLGEGLRLMVVGETRRLWVPESLAYKGQQGRPAGMLVFDVTLMDLPTRAPADVKAPPPDAQRTSSGLAYKVLTPGTGTRHPKSVDQVTVHYTGWTTDGKMFDSSVARGQPSTLPLDRVIPGWSEGMKLMVVGEKVRFWIPQNLAYQGRQPPFGMLVFDVELISIQ
jgi:FKBP-type peptidyl-prolyl cis-trans isomerase